MTARGPLAAIVDVVRRRLGDDLLRDVAHEAARVEARVRA